MATLVVVPARLDAYGRKINNDRNDALSLSSKFSRYVAGEKEALAVVRVPTLEQEQRRAEAVNADSLARPCAAWRPWAARPACCMAINCAAPVGAGRVGWPCAQNCLRGWPNILERFLPLMLQAEKQIAQLTQSLRAAAPRSCPSGWGP